jgi:hypothetical protein
MSEVERTHKTEERCLTPARLAISNRAKLAAAGCLLLRLEHIDH